jgi:hypothetical protein
MMTNRRSLIFRILADLLVAFFALFAFVAPSHSKNGAWLIAALVALLLAAGAAGYLEPSAKRIWIHPLLIMSPEFIALPIFIFTCHGFECGGMSGILIFAGLFALVLVALS